MKKVRFAVLGLVALSGFSYLIVSGLKGSSTYYLRVGELKASPRPERVRVEGDVVRGSIRKGRELEFEVTDGEDKLKVIYKGVVPPSFKEGVPVVVEGRYRPEGTFYAERIITKCPSKYEAGP